MLFRDHLARRFLPLLPRRTVRLRLTVIYAGLFLASGAVLLAITYVLVQQATGDVLFATEQNGSKFVISRTREGLVRTGGGLEATKGTKPVYQGLRTNGSSPPLTPNQAKAQAERDRVLAEGQHNAELRQLLEQSGIALAIMSALSIVLGWLAAGRVLRPLRTLNERAREISATSLHKRLALAGPDDELKQLATTFDDLLSRLEASFQAQRQFVANASHELRSPLALARTIAEVAVSDPEATVDSLRGSHLRALEAGKHQERLIEALLTLARSERGLVERETFDLATIAGRVLATCRPEADRRHIYVHSTLGPAETAGDPRLVERLVANLLDNALGHNLPAGGRIDLTTRTRDRHAILSVTNSGVPVPPDEIERLFQPFQRLGTERTDHSDGVGLGLSIVQAIATAHGATVTARAHPAGGLEIEVGFPSSNGIRDTTVASGDLEPATAARASRHSPRPPRRPAGSEAAPRDC
jgi:signal transduction histidine kinase